MPREKFSFRMAFAARWSAFLHDNYRTPEAVSKAFGCDIATARLWFDGKHIPLGHAVAIGFAEHPESAREHLTQQDNTVWPQAKHCAC